MARDDVVKTVQEALFTQKVANPGINFELAITEKQNIAEFDNRLLSQALINVIKNAVEAIEAQFANEDGKRKEKGQVSVKVWHDKAMIVMDVIDNGKGLPEEDRQKLLEPYMTTRQKGTGLGLAIVRKILEDHGGTIELMDAPSVAEGGHGAMMRLRLPNAGMAEFDETLETGEVVTGRLASSPETSTNEKTTREAAS